MTRAAKVLILKYVMTFLLAVIAFILVDRNPWSWVLAVSLSVATLNYLLGDFYILRRHGNAAASIINGVIAGLGSFIVSFFIPAFEAGLITITGFGVMVAAGEYLFHRYFMQSEEVMP
jgi:hypothetical protein